MVLLSQIFQNISSNWMIVAFLAPMSWALVNIIDVYFVDGIYNDEIDGTVISGLFQILPWIFILPLVNTHISDFFRIVINQKNESVLNFSFEFHTGLLYSFVGGLLFSLVYFLYFRALFKRNDVALVEIFNNLSVVTVPVFAFLLFFQKLTFESYLGMAITLGGATVLSTLSVIKKKLSASLLVTMILCAFFLSISMIFEEHAYSLLESLNSNNSGFWAGFLFFSIGIFVSSMIFAIVHKRNPLPLIHKYSKIFFISESISFAGTLFLQRALDISPSASYVATIDTFVPVFVLLYSLVIVGYVSMFNGNAKRKLIMTRIYKEQFNGMFLKVAAVIVMGVGIYILNY